MKKLLLILAAIAFVFVVVEVTASSSPFPPWIKQYWKQSPTDNGNYGARSARAVYDVAVNGGSTTSHGLGVFLPKGAIIKRSFYYVKTASTGDASGTVAFQCEDANNIKTATDMHAYSADTLVEGASTGATSAMTKSIANACEITAVVATGVISTGKFDIFIDYVVHD